ncbi:MAG TPA: orotidine-5'-phosphate decarboxylase [Bacteroidia bacterium]|jgi:orotidine-5'-phosphate decarboxylase|nr:orotidine-5'-phosphate decarboxylase [Bacteroidia bacterium]
MTRQELFTQITRKGSFLCVGLDPDVDKIPAHLQTEEDPIFAFNKQIIDATRNYCVAYKPNTAFYEAHGLEGWKSLEKTQHYLRTTCPDHFLIADAKRGDIGNTSAMYAKAFLEKMDFDSITVAPYMGEDSVKPFLTYKNKWVILLALTSNKGALDFQNLLTGNHLLFAEVIRKSAEWGTSDTMMYVVGATRAEMLQEIRKLIPDHFLLVPGVGAQGGSLQEVAKYGMNKQCGLLVNASRSILYAGSGTDFAEKAAAEAQALQLEMSKLLKP